MTGLPAACSSKVEQGMLIGTYSFEDKCMSKILNGLALGLFSIAATGCLNSMMKGAHKEQWLKQLAEQAGPVMAIDAELKGGKKYTVTEAKTNLQTVGTCIDSMPEYLKKQDDGEIYVTPADDIPVASGPIKVAAYYKTCRSLLQKFAKMEYETCQQRELEIRAVGRQGSFGNFNVHSTDISCKASQPCYEAVINKAENFSAGECVEGISEDIPDEFKKDERKLRKACGSGSTIVFDDAGVKLETHNYDQRLSTKTAKFRCYKEKSKGKPFAKEMSRLKTIKETQPETYKAVFSK